MTAGAKLALGHCCLIDAGFLQVQNSFRQEPSHPCYISNGTLIEVEGGESENLPSGAAEEHNSLWPCHEGVHLHTCRQEGEGRKEDKLVNPGGLLSVMFFPGNMSTRVATWRVELERLLLAPPTMQNSSICGVTPSS